VTRRLRPLVVPAEHGAWSFVLEPLVLGVIVAPSAAAFWLALATLAVFFGRQPAKLALTDLYRRQRYPRTVLAARLSVALFTLAVLSALVAWRVSLHPWWGPLLVTVPRAAGSFPSLPGRWPRRRPRPSLLPRQAGP
jgi:hypothetical protein